MTIIELQNKVIGKIKSIDDENILNLLDKILTTNNSDNDKYILSEAEKQFVSESLQDYKKGNIKSNEEVFNKIEKWLEE
jgi:hypothetical protein